MVFTILVTGSRTWTDREAIKHELQRYARGNQGVRVVHGGAHGADKIAGQVAMELGWAVKTYVPDWLKYKRGAGLIRNTEMLAAELSNIRIVLAFPKGEARGTKDMIKKCRAAGLRVIVISAQ